MEDAVAESQRHGGAFVWADVGNQSIAARSSPAMGSRWLALRTRHVPHGAVVDRRGVECQPHAERSSVRHLEQPVGCILVLRRFGRRLGQLVHQHLHVAREVVAQQFLGRHQRTREIQTVMQLGHKVGGQHDLNNVLAVRFGGVEIAKVEALFAGVELAAVQRLEQPGQPPYFGSIDDAVEPQVAFALITCDSVGAERLDFGTHHGG